MHEIKLIAFFFPFFSNQKMYATPDYAPLILVWLLVTLLHNVTVYVKPTCLCAVTPDHPGVFYYVYPPTQSELQS